MSAVAAMLSKKYSMPAVGKESMSSCAPAPALGEVKENSVRLEQEGTFFALQGAEAKEFRAVLGGGRKWWTEFA